MKILEVKPEEDKINPPKEYFEHLELNKLGFEISMFEDEELVVEGTTNKGNDNKIIKLLKAISKIKTFTDNQDAMIKKMIKLWEDGNIPANLSKDVINKTKLITDPIKVYYEIIELIPERYFEDRKTKVRKLNSGEMKVILSSYLKKGE